MSERVEVLIENCAALLFPGHRGEEEELFAHASVAIADGTIVALGGREEIAARFSAGERIDAAGRLLTPGFVDSHTHLVFGGDRADEYVLRCGGADYEEIARAGGGIRSSVRATRAASEEELFAAALPRVQRMLAAGSTAIEIKSGYGLDCDTELRMLRVIRRLADASPAHIVATFLGAHEVPDEERDDPNGFVDRVCQEMIPAVAAEGLAEFNDVFCERGVFTPEQSERVLYAGLAHGLKPKIHADELAASGGSQVAAAVGAVSADHLMETTDAGIAALAEAGVVATLLPGTTFFLDKPRYAPARKLLDRGLTVALATDRNPGSCTIESLQFIVGLACQQMGMSPTEALRAATEGGARALGRGDRWGRLASGYEADLILWQAQRPEQIVYEFVNQIPRTVFVGGVRVSP